MSETPDNTILQQKPSAARPDATRILRRAASASDSHKSCKARLLKQRFELLEVLGSGGMGTVYKARDLRQVEAGDQSPWVAVKVINETFARHEHALVALQQETKKTQRLAHPHIVSVYDFDREGDAAFMTMELLEGQSLDQLLLQKPSGLPLQEAEPLIRQICQAIAYAHRQGIVHADLKPANIFLTGDGRVKILDFGIAHAMQGSSHFDTQILNALTPAYASVRMLQGQRPQPCDDLYGLGCIFYLLLTGKHPFQRKKADAAAAAGLKPASIVGLNQRQWRALKQLMQFQPNAALNLEGFQQAFFNERTIVHRLYRRAALAAVVVLAVAVGTTLYLNQNVRQLSAQLAAADRQTVQQVMTDIRQLSDRDRVVVLERARDDIADRIEQSLPILVTATQFQQESPYLQAVSELYPDSSRIQDSIIRFEQRRSEFIDALAHAVQQRIDQRDFSGEPVSFAAQWQDLQRVAPEHALLQQDLKTLLAQEAGIAVYLGQPQRAGAILTEADHLYPDDAGRFQRIRARLHRVQSAAALPMAVPATAEVDHTLSAVQTLLQEFSLDQHPEQLQDFLNALAQVNGALYAVVRQGIREFVVDQRQKGNGKVFDNIRPALFDSVPVASVVVKAPPRQDPCALRMANLGKLRGSRCRDQLDARHQGPELVVIKTEGLTPFAITRSEISVDDFNLYCTLYRRCAPQPASTLPMVGIDLRQARFYAQWLSRTTGYRYRLPTLEEWQAAARDDSGVSDHNCIVRTSGRQVRGNLLRPVDQGYANSLGLLNVLGNVEEWVQAGNRVVLAGGAANMPIEHCQAQPLSETGVEAAGPFRGLRLVRELKL